MTRRTLRTLALAAGLAAAAAGLGACTVYDAGPSYPYGYYYGPGRPGYYAPDYYAGPDLYFGFGEGYHWHHHRWHDWR